MIAKGQITTQLRDAATLELIDEQVVNNIITEEFYNFLLYSGNISAFNIVINGKAMAPSRWTVLIPGNVAGNFALHPHLGIPSRSRVEFFPAAGDVPAFIQYCGRYNPPAAPLLIKTVVLGSMDSQGNLNAQDATVAAIAYSKLNTPCTQTTSQVLDVYYRIFFPIENSGDASQLKELLSLYTAGVENSTILQYHSFYPTPFVTKLKAGDENLVKVALAPHRLGFINGAILPTTYQGQSGFIDGKRLLNWNSNFGDYQGWMFAAMISGGKYQTNYGNDINSLNSAEGNVPALASSNLSLPSKIQNLIGHGTSAKPNMATPWLDVDNLPTGSGKIFLSGAWNNVAAPTQAGLYSKALLPQWNKIQIVATGQVANGSATYKYVKRNFFGLRDPATYIGQVGADSRNAYTIALLPSLCGTGPIVNGAAGHWRRVVPDAGRTLVEDITTTYLESRQISASCKYDEGSFILVKKNMLIIYSVGAGDYWKFRGSYTNIHQVAVVQGKIYVACRDTGLYVIDPTVSLDVVSLSNPGAGVDLSKCYGVAKGYNNSVWAVGANGLMQYNGSSWTKYDETSTPAFSIAGVSDNKWSNVEYLKVDEYSVNNEMMLVRRLTADTNPLSFGVWWSTATAAVDAFNDVLTPSLGRPRLNRSHFGGQEGLWAIANQRHKVMTFGSLAPTNVINGSAFFTDNKVGELHLSIFFVHNQQGQVRLMTMVEHTQLSTSGWGAMGKVVKLVDAAGNITDTVQSALGYGTLNDLSSCGFGTRTNRSRSSGEAGYGYWDATTSFIIDKGAMVTLWLGAENQNNEFGDVGKVEQFIAGISNYAFDMSMSGGPLAYLAETTYGWSGSAWVEALADAKPAHAAAQELSNGVMVRFEEGALGTSFTTPNFYKFGLCEGILKDNATRHNISMSYYARKRKENSTELSAYIVPAVSALGTGLVTLDLNKTSLGTVLDAGNQIVFPSEAGFMYGFSDKQVTGDFEIEYNVARIALDKEANWHSYFGVCKEIKVKQPFGFHFSKGTLYAFNGTDYTPSGISLSSVTSMKIKRLNGALTALINDVVKATNDPARSGIRTRDDRLEVGYCSESGSDISYLIPNRCCPATTIVSNGSDSMVYVGNPVNKTGVFGSRFCGIDADSVNVVKLNGVSVAVKYDGTAPAAGEVAIDAMAGAIYFNEADVGKSITCAITYTQSE